MSLPAALVRDFRYSARALPRTPVFTVVAVAVLALGIGANSANFSLVSAVWLKPLPFTDAERLVTLSGEGFWLRRLYGDPAAGGRTIDLNGSPHMVVGAVPRDFRFSGRDNEFVVPTVGVELEAARAKLSAAAGAPSAAHRLT